MEIDISPGVAIREYRFERPIGSGAYGTVWQAYHTLLDAPAAIKVIDTRDLDPQNVERVKRECQIGGRLTHQEHIVEVRNAFEENERLFIVMELTGGGSLATYLRECPCPDLRLTLKWALDLCSALQEVHELGIIHRDIKPENILLAGENVVKLSDFGIAHLPKSTLTSYQPGTPAYQAPEQAANQPVDGRADVYALCAVFFEVWSGRKHVRFRDQEPEIVYEELGLVLSERYDLSPAMRDRFTHALLAGLRPRAARASLADLEKSLSGIYFEWLSGTRPRAKAVVGTQLTWQRLYLKCLADAYRAFFRDRFIHQAMDAVEIHTAPEPDTASSTGLPSDPLMLEFVALMDREEEGETQGYDDLEQLERAPVADLRRGLGEYETMALLGAPGAGKTSALLWLLGTWREAENKVNRLPVFVSLSRYNEGPFENFLVDAWVPSLSDALRANEEHQKKLESAVRPLRRRLMEYLADGRAVLFLDALNELPRGSSRQERLNRLRYFVQEANELGNWVIVSCRQRDYAETLESLQRVEIRPLDDTRVCSFLQAYLGAEQGSELWSRLRESGYARLRELIRNPFLLAGLVSIAQRGDGALPTARTALLDRLAALSIGWEKRKRHPRWVPKQKQEKVLGALALAMTALGKTVVNKAELAERLPDAWFFEPGRREPLLDDVLRLAQGARLARWTPEANGGSITFEHQVWQEYYAARLLAGMYDPEWRGLVRCASGRGEAITPFDALERHLHDSLWRSIVVLTSTLLGESDASEFIRSILGSSHDYGPLQYQSFRLAAECLIEGATTRPGVKRAVSDYFLVLARDAEAKTDTRLEAVETAGQLGCLDEATDILLATVQDAGMKPTTRRAAGEALGRLNQTEEAADALLSLAQDGAMHLGFRRVTAEALGRLGRVDQAANVLRSLMLRVRFSSREFLNIVCALGRLGFVNEPAEILLTLAQKAVRDKGIESRDRWMAVETLGQIGCADEAAEVLLAVARDLDVKPRERQVAAQALELAGYGEEAAEAWVALARDTRVELPKRWEAAKALRQLGYVDEATEVFLAWARNTELESAQQRGAARALGQLGSVSEAIEVLLALAQDTEVRPRERRKAAEELGRLERTNEAVDVLLALARNAGIRTGERRRAAEELGRLGLMEEAIDVLLALARDAETRPDERRRAAETLRQLGRVDEATEALLTLVRDTKAASDQRWQAVKALERLGRLDEMLDALKSLAQDAQWRDRVARILYSLAIKLQEQAQLDEAIKVLRFCRHINERLGYREDIAATLTRLGEALQANGELDEAIKAFRHSLEINKELGSKEYIARTLFKLGEALQAQGELDGAIAAFKRCLEIDEHLDDQRYPDEAYEKSYDALELKNRLKGLTDSLNRTSYRAAPLEQGKADR